MSLLTRPALYYPHLQFTDVNWLKEALLSFRQVRRMAPGGYSPTAADVSGPVRDLEAPGLGPLVMTESLDDTWPERAQGQLYEWLRTQPANELQRFDRAHTIARYDDPDSWQMHPDKFTYSMFNLLQQHHLTWEAGNVSAAQDARSGFDAVALHPQLGEAIMAAMAIEIAERKQLNIVTPQPRVHKALLTRRQDEVLASLAQDDPANEPLNEIEAPQLPDLPTSAAQLLIHKHLDLSWVSLEDVAAIVKDGNGFQQFRVRLQKLAAELDLSNIKDPVEQAKQVEALADAARDEWDSYRRGLGSFAKMYVATALDDKLETAITAGVPAIAGLSSLGLASVGIGLAVGVLTVASKTAKKLVQRRKTDPYRYLSQLMAHGATIVADIADD
jgi:hypothetical protein